MKLYTASFILMTRKKHDNQETPIASNSQTFIQMSTVCKCTIHTIIQIVNNPPCVQQYDAGSFT